MLIGGVVAVATVNLSVLFVGPTAPALRGVETARSVGVDYLLRNGPKDADPPLMDVNTATGATHTIEYKKKPFGISRYAPGSNGNGAVVREVEQQSRYPGDPRGQAFLAGVQPGWVVAKVNGQDVKGTKFEDLMEYMDDEVLDPVAALSLNLKENGVSSEGKGIGEKTFVFGQGVHAELPMTIEYHVKAAEYRINRTLEFCPDGVLAREIINEMCSNGTVPGPLAWNAVIDSFGQRGALDEALAVYREMQEARVAANDATYDVLARPAMRRGEFRFVETLYGAKAVDRGGSIGSESLAILLQSYANGQPPQPDKAVTAFRCEMEAAEEQGLTAAEAASGAVLQALRNAAGLNQSCDLCWDYGIDPAGML